MGLNRGTIRRGKKKVISKNNDVKQILDNMDLYDFQKKAVMDTIESLPVREVKYDIKEEVVEESLIQSTSLLSDDIEEVIEETVKTPPEPIDEVIEVSDEEVVVEIEVLNTEKNINNTVYSEEVIKDIVKEDKSKELEEMLKEEENKSDEEKKVICLDTLDVYENAKDAESKTPAKASAITRNCNGNSKRAGGLRWMYYKNYLLQENK